ncbi:hypothetical protein [uncultured Duncaniella sp.]|uniref:hypothetical protein n=1 Tax=uncultured Duncaniella sp. TaxID=2768039 RepID=UPI0026160E6A|nr:hypothetical protein [uncultured Duncaniella sp.]
MNSAKDKDRILAEIKAYTPHQQIEGLDKYLPELELEGLVDIWLDEQGKPITVRLNKCGQDFIKAGGYGSKVKRKRNSTIKELGYKALTAPMKFAVWLLGGLILALIASISDKVIDHWWLW